MDIIIHILFIVVIGLFFFINKFSSSTNSMFFVIILTITGFILLQTSNIEYINYNAVEKVNSTYYQHPTTIMNGVSLGLFTVGGFITLVYWFFMILAVLNITLGKKEMKERD